RTGGGVEDFLDANVLAALFAGCGDGDARFRLLVPAAGASHQDLILFLRWHSMLTRAGSSGGSASAYFSRLGNFGRFARAWRRGGGRDLVRVDLGFPDESDALFDDELGGADVAEQLGLGFDVDFFLGADVAVDLAAHHHVRGVDVAIDDGAVAQVQGAVGVDFAVQFAVKGQFAGKFEIAFDFNIRVQHVFRRGARCAHSGVCS